MSVVVCDLDGTLANIDHRLPLIKEHNPRRWDEFRLACDKDVPNEWCVKIVCAMLEMGHTVKIVTARYDVALVKTVKWLDQHVPGVELAMIRKVRDHRQDDVLKEEWLNSQDKSKILFVIDDHQRVVDMWRRNGLVCLQCYPKSGGYESE